MRLTPRRRTSCRPAGPTRVGASDGRVVAAGGFLGEQDAQDFGVFPALAGGGRDHLRRGPADVWHAQAAQQSVELVGQRRWGGRLDGHRRIPPRCGSRPAARTPLGSSGQRDHGRGLLVGEDAGQVTVGEPAVAGAPREGVVDRPGAMELGQVDRLGHLATDPLRSLRSGVLEPPLGALPDRKEVALLARAGAGPALQRPGRPRRVVLVLDAGATRRGQPVAGDLSRPLIGSMCTTTSCSPSARTQTRSPISSCGTE